jgi:hypothetical protein
VVSVSVDALKASSNVALMIVVIETVVALGAGLVERMSGATLSGPSQAVFAIAVHAALRNVPAAQTAHAAQEAALLVVE